jgi:mannose-6-phosphate isomerase-like protein (cupin superfamily)
MLLPFDDWLGIQNGSTGSAPRRRSRAQTRRMQYCRGAAVRGGVTMQAVKDSSGLYEVERRAYYAQRPGFRIAELQISPTQKVPWHYHNNVHDTFYVVEGTIRIFLQAPKEEVRLERGQTYSVPPKRPHLVTNAGKSSAVFLVLQGIGEYDFVPLV